MKVEWDNSITPTARSAVMRVLNGDKVLSHEQKDNFEKEYCRFFDRKFAIAISSGTAGLHCALLACGVGPGDEVIAPPNTDWSILYSILYARAKPVFSEVEDDTMNIEPDQIEQKITPKTKAIIAVSTAGHPLDYDPLLSVARKHSLRIVNDCAQALGAKYKGQYAEKLGDLSITSFGYHKHLPSGPVGVVATDSEELADLIHKYSHQGEGIAHQQDQVQKYIKPAYADFDIAGFRYGPSELHCAIARVQLKRFIDGTFGPERRRKNAAYYNKLLNERLPEIRTPIEKNWAYHTYLRYIIRATDRDKLFIFLLKKNIRVFIHYGAPLHLHKLHGNGENRRGKFPITEKMAKEVLTLPSWPTLTRKQLDYVVKCVVEFYEFRRS